MTTFTVVTALLALSLLLLSQCIVSTHANNCRFSDRYSCDDFFDPASAAEYLHQVIAVEAAYASAGVGYDAATGIAFDGHQLLTSTNNNTTNDTSKTISYRILSAGSPSHESIHLSLIALALSGDHGAMLYFHNNVTEIFNLLELKLHTYEAFNQAYPGYGCFLTWVDIMPNTTAGIETTESWQRQGMHILPASQNGMWFWSLYALSFTLDRFALTHSSGSNSPELDWYQLASRVKSIVDCQKSNAKFVFYRGRGKVSATAFVINATAQPSRFNYGHCDGDLADDNWEGDPLLRLLEIFADWQTAPEQWERKVHNSYDEGDLRARPYIDNTVTQPDGSLSIRQYRIQGLQVARYRVPSVGRDEGEDLDREDDDSLEEVVYPRAYWLAAHEQWKLLLLPYLTPYISTNGLDEDAPSGFLLSRQALVNLEKVRTWDARNRGQLGLFTSLSDALDGPRNSTAGFRRPIIQYDQSEEVVVSLTEPSLLFTSTDDWDLSDYSEIRSEPTKDIFKARFVSPSAAFPLFLVEQRDALDSEGWVLPARRAGFCWYNQVLGAKDMQSSLGALESVSGHPGHTVNPLRTWETKAISVLAMLGGVAHITQEAMLADTLPSGRSAYERFIDLVDAEYRTAFGRHHRDLLDNNFNARLGFAVPSATRKWTQASGLSNSIGSNITVDGIDPDC